MKTVDLSETIVACGRVRSFTGMDQNGLNYRNGLPEWTFIYGFECCNAFYMHIMAYRSHRE